MKIPSIKEQKEDIRNLININEKIIGMDVVSEKIKDNLKNQNNKLLNRLKNIE